MLVKTTVRKQGGAMVMTIPPTMLKQLNLKVGAQMELDVNEGKLIAKPLTASRKRYRLSELLKGSEQLKKLNKKTAWAFEGEAVGRELA
ncbi:MAG: PbsX family transcriptional regulator [Proteobacteria bacterium]|nr:PbsX family transcriptional regulator [Pseudomonadota bacterium]